MRARPVAAGAMLFAYGLALARTAATADRAGERAVLKLFRYSSFAGLIALVAVTVALSWFYRRLAFDALVETETRANVALTKAFANSIWPSYATFVREAGKIPPSELPKRDEIRRLGGELKLLAHGLDVVKVKVYDTNGLTVFSTDSRQIGQDKRTNGGFAQALGGEPASEITFRDHFDAWEGEIADRNIIATYVPVRVQGAAPVEAVMEVYSDVTPLVAKLERTQIQLASGAIGALSLLYALMLSIAGRSDRILREQEAERIASEERVRYQAYHDPLTGLPNRASFAEHLEQAIHRSKRFGWSLGLMFLDLDLLQAGERQPRPRIRRRAAAGGGAPPPGLDPRGRHAVPHGRRRVHGAPRERQGAGGGGGDRGAHEPGGRRAGRAQAPRARRHRQHRHRAVPEGRRKRRAPGEERRHRDVPRERARPQPLRVLHPGDERPRREPAHARSRAAARGPQRRVRPPLPAAGVGRDAARRRRRGAAPLEASRAGPRVAGRVHPAARGVGADRTGRRAGDRVGLPPEQGVAGRGAAADAGVGQHLVAPVPDRVARGDGPRGAARERACARVARDRADREPAGREQRARGRASWSG